MIYDLITVGAGPAGLTAAVYARRAGMTVLVLEKGGFGGQMNYSPRIENFPGIASAPGAEIADAMVGQALGFGADIEPDEVGSIVRGDDGIFTVTSESGRHVYTSRTVIWAAGARHRRLGLPREEELIGRGVSFCAVCDGDFFSGRHVAVIGGGNSAVGDALMLADKCEKVTVIQNLSALTAEESTVSRLLSKPNVEVLYNTVVSSLHGEEELSAIELRSEIDGSLSRLVLDGIFVAIGLIPENGIVSPLVPLDGHGYAVVGEDCTTPTPGFFVAGDCRAKGLRQITTAVADGAVSASAAARLLR